MTSVHSLKDLQPGRFFIWRRRTKEFPGLIRILCCLVVLATGCVFSFAADAPTIIRSGDLLLTVGHSSGGITLQSLRDSRVDQELLATNANLPLFEITLRKIGSPNELRLKADTGWLARQIQVRGNRLKLEWSRPENPDLQGLSVVANSTGDSANSALRWKLQVDNRNANWSVWRVTFPQIALSDFGPGAAVFFPRGPGEVQRDAWSRALNYQGTYPDGWCAMQFMAAYREGKDPTGLYFAVHDPNGATKGLSLRNDQAAHTVKLGFDIPAPDQGIAANGFGFEGEAVWQLLRGDWFDAAGVYRRWAKKEARWWPRLGREGRTDTPKWMRELNVWAMTGGAPADCAGSVKAFRDFMGMPIGFHWYNWHEIPFDNDYPHYFPAKRDFAKGVADLESAGVHVMPYINGRLWDSHDRGSDDWEFSRVALPSVCKSEEGSPIIESYGSKETNGAPVRLGVMCPTSPLWHNTVSNIVLRLLGECGTSGVYIDQVAAAAPKLCQDKAHGHPLGGGHWWTEGYWKMLQAINRSKPRGSMLTTECNGEPFIHCFDGYLTWHWQYDGQVPAFPAVYGGAIQMFGRAYRGGATKDLALRMKAGQQLVFGEQLGWLDPTLVQEPDNAGFFRQLAQLRNAFSRYFYAGEMARPPKLEGEMPRAKADWQWSGEWWVTTDAVLTGAWTLPRERRTILLFVNVTDTPVRAAIRPDFSSWGFARRKFSIHTTAGTSPPSTSNPLAFGSAMTFPAREAQVWEVTW
jgi:hypothetical protein